MNKIKLSCFLLFCCIGVSAQKKISGIDQPGGYKNSWTKPPSHIPNDVSIDAPLMGNGDVTMSVGYKGDCLRYYLSKNDFWRLRSQADGLSGPRMVGFVDIKIEDFSDAAFTAEQKISNGITTCLLNKNNQKIETKSWVSATDNLVFIELSAIDKAAKVSINLTAPENKYAKLKTGKAGDTYWLTRAFADSVDIKTEVAVALKTINYTGDTVVIQPGKKLIIALAIESKFKKPEPLEYVLGRIKRLNKNAIETTMQQHNKWWQTYWDKSSVTVEDTVLMKAYYQGLYTMASCSRDKRFPPGIFGWTTTDNPMWNGDYHLNYNFQAPFYGLFAANRVAQGEPHDAPLIDFIPRGEWYAKNVTNTRGILYPVGIGPLGIEVTRNFAVGGYQKKGDIEQEGLFYGQRSNASYGLINMAQHWRCTYDIAYGKKIYPYALAIANFWEDYLKFENGRYVIYGDAIHEGSGKDKNPVLSLGLIRNALDLIIDLSSTLKVDENRQAKWKDILSKLSDFPVQIRNGKKVFRYTEEGVDWWDGNGLGIQQIYPANAITLDSKEELLTVARNTIDEMQRWQDTNTSNSFFVAGIRVGYDPSVIINELHKYALHIYPNGFQLNNPHGIENSCTVANALNEMLCMSAGNVIRLFSVFPKNQNASFKNIRTWGAFLVSARLTNGVVSDVKIVSEKGMPCTFANPWPGKAIRIVRNGKNAEFARGSRFTIKTIANEVIGFKPE
ncbi:glycosyl hydrolase family 95 catalytic domain-containing protein [Mucilaginibacter sp. OK098]|uniref:glycosyl hydrolase family 95 catalytic domain-containing protein n=1 Tax=Mucilaginibacter sp. OK098 TaxID=1855297 RepID=UPI000919F80B|nr:hypothetical protein [Mucilaginibacter sp. OK098]SHM76152.1 hypothetical protein SAMN05216524_103319 [Mucilaginibacter sp. OK098]